MSTMDNILNKYQEFNSFLQSIDLEELKKQHTREELNDFKKRLYNINLRSVAYEISKITEAMKLEEFPQLLGVHRFPVINEANFLTDSQKVEVDEFLGKHRVGHYLTGIYSLFDSIPYNQKDSLIKKLESFLIEKKIVEETHIVPCPNCNDSYTSSRLTNQDKEKLEKALTSEDDDRYEILEEILQYNCDECFHDIDFDTLKSVYFKTSLKVIMARDTSLDNI